MKNLLIRAGALTLTTSAVVTLLACATNPTDPKLANSKAGRACKGPEAVIADADDNNNQTNVVDGRGGYWYTFSDALGSTVWPKQGAMGGTFEMSPGGAESTPYAAHMKGKVGSHPTQPIQVGMGFNFLDPPGPIDASKYGGISFWAKKGPGSQSKVRVKVPDRTTAPEGGVCSECFNDYGMDVTLTEEWQHFILPWGSLKQLEGWGKPRGFSVSEEAIFAVQFQVQEQGKEFDIWVDQIRFTGCAD